MKIPGAPRIAGVYFSFSRRGAIVFVLSLLLPVLFSSLAASDDQGRQEAIGVALDCMEATHSDTAAVDWQDVCVRQGSPSRRLRAIERDFQKYELYRRLDNPSGNERLLDQPLSRAEDSFYPAPRARRAETTVEPVVVTPRQPPSLPDSFGVTSDYFAPSDEAPGDPLDRRRRHVEFGMEIFPYTYKEPGLMKMKGTMLGAYGTLNYRYREHETWDDITRDSLFLNFFRLNGRFAYGELDYTSTSTGKDDNIPNYVVELRGLLGCDLPELYQTRATPYIGLGYRYLLDDSGGRLTTTNNWSYDRESQYVYIPLGVETSTALDPHWSIEAMIEYDLFLWGLQKSHLGDGGQYNPLYAGYPVVENKQEKGFGFRGGVKAVYQHDRLDFVVEPFVRLWSIGNSKTKTITYNGETTSWIEPKNKTTEFGCKFGLRF